MHPHGVLPAPEVRKPLNDEAVESQQPVRPGDRPREMIQRSRVPAEALLDQFDHRASDRVGFTESGRWNKTRALCPERAAVLGVKVPGAARGSIAVHENPVRAPLSAVEGLHDQTSPAGGVARELVDRAQKVPIYPLVEAHCGRQGRSAQVFAHLPLAGFDQHHHLRAVALDRGEQFGGEGAAVLRVVEALIVDSESPVAKFPREVPHRREKDHDARFADPYLL